MTVLPAPAINRLENAVYLAKYIEVSPCPEHHSVPVNLAAQSVNSGASRNHRPVPSWIDSNVLLCLFPKLNGDSQVKISLRFSSKPNKALSM